MQPCNRPMYHVEEFGVRVKNDNTEALQMDIMEYKVRNRSLSQENEELRGQIEELKVQVEKLKSRIKKKELSMLKKL